MRRFIVFVIVLLALGAATAVGVAWAYASIEHPALARNRLSSWSDSRFALINGWRVHEWSGAGKHARLLQPELVKVRWPFGEPEPFAVPAWSVAVRPPVEGVTEVLEDARGWPWPSLRCTWRQTTHLYHTIDEKVTGGIPIAPFTPDWMIERHDYLYMTSIDMDYVAKERLRALPLIPMWRGLLASTVFLAVLWTPVVFLISSPGTLRRFERRRRRRCIRCAYALRGIDSTACPECGWAVDRRYPWITAGRIVVAGVLLALVVSADAAIAVSGTRGVLTVPPIHVAARHGDMDRLDRILRQGTNVDLPMVDPDYVINGSTPLMWAAAHGQVAAMRRLLEAGADVNAADDNGTTALSVAAAWGHADAIDVLADAGADLEAADRWEGRVALMHAAGGGHVQAMRRLIDAGANVHQRTGAGMTALCYGAQSSERRVVTLLLKAGATVHAIAGDEPNAWPLAAAAGAGRAENIALLLAAGAGIDLPASQPPLYRAVANGHAEAAIVLLANGAATGRDVGPLLWEAAEKELTGVARLLLERGADPNHAHGVDGGWTPLRRAILLSNLELVRLLLDAGADPQVVDDDGKSLLFYINWVMAPPALVDLVLSLGIDVDRQTRNGNTALMEAVFFRRYGAVRKLLDEGADPSIRNHQGHTAIDYARKKLAFTSGVTFGGKEPDPELVRILQQTIGSGR